MRPTAFAQPDWPDIGISYPAGMGTSPCGVGSFPQEARERSCVSRPRPSPLPKRAHRERLPFGCCRHCQILWASVSWPCRSKPHRTRRPSGWSCLWRQLRRWRKGSGSVLTQESCSFLPTEKLDHVLSGTPETAFPICISNCTAKTTDCSCLQHDRHCYFPIFAALRCSSHASAAHTNAPPP